jgi:hypothetical protein
MTHIGQPEFHDIVVPMDENVSGGVPQFATAEYSGKTGETACKSCGQAISGAYYRVNGAQTCADCAGRIKEQMLKDSHTSFARGVSFGIGGAILGLGIYVAFALATGLMIGYISLAVGYIVGKAIVMGSGGRGGRRYQLAALLLTYSAVSLAAVPIAISQNMKQRNVQQHAQVSDSAAVSTPKMSPGKALGVLALIGLASPFLELSSPAHGIIGLVILFVGIRIAWKITAGTPVNILGPISESVPAAAG